MTARVSLVRRIAVTAAAWAALLLVAGAVGLTALYRSTVLRDVDERLDEALRELVLAVHLDEGGAPQVAEPDVGGAFRQALSGRYWLVARLGDDGRLEAIAQSRSVYDGELILAAGLVERIRARPGALFAGDGRGPADEPVRVRAEAIFLDASDRAFVLAAAADRRALDRDVRRFAWATAWTLGAFALVLAALVVFQVRWGLAPLFRMRDEVAQVRSGAQARLDEAPPAELAPLAAELNALLAHNQDIVERARSQVGNLAHALKTPISILLNDTRGAEGPLAASVRRQTAAMTRQVDHYLKRASAAARAQTKGARADAAGVIDDIARTLPRMYPDKPVALEVRRPDQLWFRGERQDLEEMVGNLMDNAFKWADGVVRVEARPDAPQEGLVVSVEDDGPGLPEEKREEVMRRGARLDEREAGSGLGLSIVDDLARAYGGALRLGDGALGGLRATLVLPMGEGASVTRR